MDILKKKEKKRKENVLITTFPLAYVYIMYNGY